MTAPRDPNDAYEAAASARVQQLLQLLGENPGRDGLVETPLRVARALRDMTAGYRIDPAEILATSFDEKHDGLITLDHIEFVSMCEHHMMAFMGHVHIGYLPNDAGRVVGVSKLARLVDCFAKRLQVQERMTAQIARALEEHLKPQGVAVIAEARHSCVCARGVGKQSSVMRTSVMIGSMRESHAARAEFMQLVGLGAR